MRLLLLLTGWTLFGLSLALPALRTSGLFGLFGGTFSGWLCLGGSVLSIGGLASGGLRDTYQGLVGLCNLLMLASPALAAWGGRWSTQQRIAFLAAAVVVCHTKQVGGCCTEYLAGYYVWCASFLVVAAALQFE